MDKGSARVHGRFYVPIRHLHSAIPGWFPLSASMSDSMRPSSASPQPAPVPSSSAAPTITPGWADSVLIDAMRESDEDTGHHSQWWKGMNNGMSKCWLMQDGHDSVHTRYGVTDGAPLSFVYECNESSLPQEALDAVFLFSQHSMLNLRGAMVPTKMLVPRVECTDRGKWKIVGVWKKRATDPASLPPSGGAGNNSDDDGARSNGNGNDSDTPSSSSGSSSSGDSNEGVEDRAQRRRGRMAARPVRRRRVAGRRGVRSGVPVNNRRPGADGGIHDMDLTEGMPVLGGGAEGTDLENISPVRIEAWMVKVFHYASDSDITLDRTVFRKMFCVLTVTPVRNLNLAEYLRHSIVENTQGMMFPGMSQQASENMRKDKKDMLHRLLLGQMELCGFFSKMGAGVSVTPPDPLDALNMPSTDYYPSNYLSVPMAYRRIQYAMHKQVSICHVHCVCAHGVAMPYTHHNPPIVTG